MAVADHLKQPTRGSPLPVWTVWVTPRRLFGLAPTGGYRATTVAGRAVGSYPTVSPLPPAETDGGLFSVALSVALRRPGVTWRSTLWSSDFPRAVVPHATIPPDPGLKINGALEKRALEWGTLSRNASRCRGKGR